MKSRPSRPAFSLVVNASAKSFLSILLSAACILTLGIDLPAQAANAGASTPAKDKKPKQDPVLKGLPITELSADEAILHALNRLAYGPRPGDIERVRQIGLAKWIDQQLNPNSIDDKTVEARLDTYPTLRMSSKQLLADYPQPKQAEKQAQKGTAATPTRGDAAAAVVAQDMRANQTVAGQSSNAADVPNSVSPMKESAAQAEANPVTPGAGGGGKRGSLTVDPNAVPRAIADDSHKPQRVVEELAMAKVTRAVYSERQLQQIMDDFWFNHFNVFAGKGDVKWLMTSYERDVIQPHTLGKFKDLLNATAKSPAMLFYLDNYLSADPNAAARAAAERAMRQQAHWGRFGGPPPRPQQQAKKGARGLNENYGRELMELHTLGVDGGYTQKDVTEVARCFTGWSIEKPKQEATFKFDETLHDPDQKIVLSKKIHAGGMKDGEEVINLLAKNPNTAKFISTKLARRFVSDNPPPALVARMAKEFQSSDGDIRAVMKTMIYSPEFWSRDAYRAKVKTPFELVVSTARALGTDVDTPMPLVQWTGRIGEPLYQCQPPTGYSDKADAWVNTGALLNRLNYSLALASNKVRGSRSDTASLLGVDDTGGDAKAALDRAVQVFLGGQTSPTTVETLQKQIDSPQILQAKLDDPIKRVDLGVVAGLVLGAPEFQRR
ncbi:MAG TPA: DUF1800 domain-containing protein [Candidatus Sulfotelmatobacter sp.]|nr:DUF1800 domain-containing protein [Candidatus Sulfotelmatobacter sp.]